MSPTIPRPLTLRARARAAKPLVSAILTPWPTDLEYLNDELDWVAARATRLALQRRVNELQASEELLPSKSRYRSVRHMLEEEEGADPRVLQRRLATANTREEALRSALDARLLVHRAQGPELALDRLVRLHGLDEVERSVLLLAAGPCVSGRFEKLYGALESDQSDSLTVDVVFAFNALSYTERVQRRRTFAPRGTLASKDLVDVSRGGRCASPKDLLSTEITMRGRTLSYILGDSGLGDELAEVASVESPLASFDRLVLPAADKTRILRVVEDHERYLTTRTAWGLDEVIGYGRGTLLLFHGAPGTGKTMAAHAVAQRLGKRVLHVDIPTFIAHQDAGRFIPGLFREARLQDAILFFDECETLFESRSRGNALMTVLLTEVERFEGVAVLATNLPERLDEALDRRILVRVRFPEPDRDAREAIWRGLLPPTVPLAPDVDLSALAERYELAGGYIKNCVLIAVARAVHESSTEAPHITHEMLDAAAREQSQRGTDDDEAVPEVPRVRLSDVVLPDDARATLDELVSAARSRRMVLERWKLGEHLSYGKGLAALFYGAPGTGKTLCAQAIAGELYRPLLLGSIATIVSKWVGETERNLAHLFERARKLGAVLFLDEADALLGSREDAGPSRHDVSSVNVLLSELERFDGVVLLATNLPGRLDSALARRLTYRLELRRPDVAQRVAIWSRLVTSSVPVEGALDFPLLAERHPLSGARIKNAVFKAAFRAASAGRSLAHSDLERAAREECEAEAPAGKRSVGFGAS